MLIRLQNKTPEVYSHESRDFQLLLRIYDCVVNGLKFDIDTITTLTDSHLCRTNMLQLLQTKLGFFTNKDFDDATLRYILESFPVIVKNKGSLTSIGQAINVFLKINHINSKIVVMYNDRDNISPYSDIQDHTIVVGLNTKMVGIEPLTEILRYIMPVGFAAYFYFFDSYNDIDEYCLEHDAKVVYISDNINANLRQSTEFDYKPNIIPSSEISNIISSVDTIEFASNEYVRLYSEPEDFRSKTWKYYFLDANDGIIKPLRSAHVWDKSLKYYFRLGDCSISEYFYGIFDTIADAESYGATNNGAIIISKVDETIAGSPYTEYIKLDGEWRKLNFRGIYSEISVDGEPEEWIPATPQNYDIIALKQDHTPYLYDDWNKKFVLLNYVGEYDRLEDAPVALHNLIIVDGSYWVYNTDDASEVDKWNQITYVNEEYTDLAQLYSESRLRDKGLYMITGYNYYMYNDNKWSSDNVPPLYLYKEIGI